jgi:hypothetical protein
VRGVEERTGTLQAVRLARAIFGLTTLLFVIGLWILVSGSGGQDPFGLPMFTFSVFGFLIASRQPRNAIGWIMLGIGLVWLMDVPFAFAARPPVAYLVLSAGTWVLGIVPIGSFLILLFPDGHLPTPRWRPWAWLCAAAIIIPYGLITLYPANFGEQGFPEVSNPIGIEALRPYLGVLFATIMLIPVSFVGCAVALILRLRRSHGQERLQLKWLATTAAMVVAVYLATLALSLPFELTSTPVPGWVAWLQHVSVASFLLIPVAVGVAILKYRLYDIDVIINRALVYTALTALLTLAYLALVTVLQSLFRPLTGESTLAVATSTLTAAALFRPARGGVQAFIDRRFYRKKYDAVQTVETFSARLRDEIDLDALTAELVTVVGDAVQPSHVSLWLRRPQPAGGTTGRQFEPSVRYAEREASGVRATPAGR